MSWVIEMNRDRIVAAMGLFVAFDLWWFFTGRALISSTRDGMEAGARDWRALPGAFAQLASMVAFRSGKLPPRIFEFVMCSVAVLEASTRISAHVPTAVTVFVAFPVFTCVRLRAIAPTGLGIHAVIALCAGQAPEDAKSGHLCFLIFSLLGGIFALYQHANWKCIFDLQHDLAVEKRATEKLLAMLCDAGCWLAPDGDAILRNDARLNEIIGLDVSGSSFRSRMPLEERQLFRAATVDAKVSNLQDPVLLLPSSLYGSDMKPQRVDLFIVDIRSEFAALADRTRPGFLIGIRLAAPECTAPAIEQAPFDLVQASASPSSQHSSELGFQSPTFRLPICDLRTALADRANTSEIEVHRKPSDPTSIPETLRSAQLPCPIAHNCGRKGVLDWLLDVGDPGLDSPRLRDTVDATLELMCDHALGGALVCVADSRDFQQVFAKIGGSQSCTRSSDEGYMTDFLRGVHVRDARFREAFREFTRHTSNDRWPDDHPDERARGQPKDGAILLSTRGYRVQCSAKLLGLAPAASWGSFGTKHEAALACAWAIPGCFVFVKSDSGPLHVVVKHGDGLHVCSVHSDN